MTREVAGKKLQGLLPAVSTHLNWWNGLWTWRKRKHLQKILSNVKVTIFCSCVTVLVLRGTFGSGSFYYRSDPAAQDLQELHENLVDDHANKLRPRELAADREEKQLEEEEEDDEENDPEPDPNVPYSLGPEIKDWNQQRALWLSKNPHKAKTANGKDRLLLVTGSQPKPCDNPVGDHYLLKAIKNKIDYCRLHDIEIFYNMAHLDQEMTGFWSKLPLLRKLMLAHPEVEWIWWMDSDAMFTDMVFELPIENYKDYNLVLHGYKEQVYQNKSWVGLNTGNFLFRNCQWSLDLLDAWAPMGPKGAIRVEAGKILSQTLAGRADFEADDQSALIYLLVTQKQLWSSKVYLEESYYLHGYWVVLVETYEELMEKYHPGFGDHRWPFVTHFVGCKPCGSYRDYSLERCLHQMERAFNFADNQILQSYGFQHSHLATTEVKRSRMDTIDPLDLQLGVQQQQQQQTTVSG
jgi:xyloglucan 6-xylosyltransferase